MKKFLLVLFVLLAPALAHATDWSRYDSGERSLRVTGYKTQPGYIGFYDENQTLRGMLYAHSNGNLYWAVTTATTGGRTATDLTTTKLGSGGGEQKVNN